MSEIDMQYWLRNPHGWVFQNDRNIKAPCGGLPGGCATCKQELKEQRVMAANKAFEQQLWTFTAVNNRTGAESVLYGHATYNVFEHALAKAAAENSWLKVQKYEQNFKCDYPKCPGHHPTRENYCSATRMYEDMLADPKF